MNVFKYDHGCFCDYNEFFYTCFSLQFIEALGNISCNKNKHR